MTLRGAIWPLLVPFVLLATANSAGYRYGASDLAFYGPAVMRQIEPQLFPRDRELLDTQARLTFMDETVGAVARLTTAHLPALFLALYVLTLLLLALGVAAVGGQMYRSRWAAVALLAAVSLRHAIPSSGTNTLEGYFHPRQLAFAFGTLAIAAYLSGRIGLVPFILLAAAVLHPTTALWLGVWLGVAVFISERRWRAVLAAIAGAGALFALWAVAAGPLAGRLVIMDDAWLEALAEKRYLFPHRWPLTSWVINLGYAAIVLFVYRRRAAARVLLAREPALVAGCLCLVPLFLIAAVLNVGGLALAIQLQPARTFWMLDFLGTVYLIWALAEGSAGAGRRSVVVAAAFAAAATARGAYIMRVEFPDRPLFQADIPGDWGRVATWARFSTDRRAGWLAHPMHAARYGTSLRMAAARDVFVEGVKDSAVGMYDREVALRTRDRLQRVGDFEALPADRARQLGAKYDLQYLVTEAEIDLPLVFRSGALRVYRLR